MTVRPSTTTVCPRTTNLPCNRSTSSKGPSTGWETSTWSAVSVLVLESSSPLASKTSPSLKSTSPEAATSPSIRIDAPGAAVMLGLNHSMVMRLTAFVTFIVGGGVWGGGAEDCVSPSPQEASVRQSSALEHRDSVIFIATLPAVYATVHSGRSRTRRHRDEQSP